MTKIKKALLFAALIVLLMGIAYATEAPNTNVTDINDATRIVKDTTTISESDTIIQENIREVKTAESTTKTIQKSNITKSNIKKDNLITVSSWDELSGNITALTSESGDTTIKLNEDTYTNNGIIRWEGTNMVLTIDGNGQTINGNQKQVFYINSGSSIVLKNIIIKDAKQNGGSGGAIYNSGNLTIINSTLTHNTASYGGAIINVEGNLTVSNSLFTHNTASYGGAIYNWGSLTVNNSNYTNNNATNGGAIHNYRGTLTVMNNSLFECNQAVYGGAICNNGTQFVAYYNVSVSNFTKNNASYGAALYNTENTRGNLTYNNFTKNTAKAGGSGGAIYNKGNLTIINSTLTHSTASYGGAIRNDYGPLTINNSNLTYNNATNGGAIHNNDGHLTVNNSNLTHNNAKKNGGAIHNPEEQYYIDIVNSNFTQNHANTGAAINTMGFLNATDNNFIENTADNKETIWLNGIWNGLFATNHYYSTDINLSEIKLSVKDDKKSFTYCENIELNFTIKLSNPNNYGDFSEGIEDITLNINGEEEVIRKYEAYNLTQLKPGKYNVYFTSCNSQSNTVTFTITGDSEITTDKESYDYYDGIKNMVQLFISDEIGEPGTIYVRVKDVDEYDELLTCHNVKDGYTLQTATLVEVLENIYDNLDSSYTINVTYYSDYVSPSSTEFTLNIIKQRNTTIIYDILNNTEGNLQINITVIDALNHSIIEDSGIKVTGDINKNTTSSVLIDHTLTPGDYTINVHYNETEEYKSSDVRIEFTVEIDYDKKISELKETITNLTEKIDETNSRIYDLTSQLYESKNKINNLINQLSQANNLINELNNKNKNLQDTINDLTQQLIVAEKKINDLNDTINELLNKIPLNTTITINPIKSSVGNIVNLSANIIDVNNAPVTGGKAIFKVNGITLKDENNNVIYAMVNNGMASISYKVQSVWYKDTSYLQAVYSGNENYTSTRTTASDVLDITKGIATITFDKTDITAKSGQTVTLRAKITDTTGTRITGGKVVFKLNGKTLKGENGEVLYAQVIDGKAELDYIITTKYSAKTYTLTAVYGGNNYERTETNGTLTLENKEVNINVDSITTNNNKTSIKATITYETGLLIVTSTKIAIKINGKTVLSGVNSTNGKIDLSFITTLRPGMYELLIISGENGIYKTGKVTTVLKI